MTSKQRFDNNRRENFDVGLSGAMVVLKYIQSVHLPLHIFKKFCNSYATYEFLMLVVEVSYEALQLRKICLYNITTINFALKQQLLSILLVNFQ